MKISRLTDSQIMQTLKQAESGISAPDLCRAHGIPIAIRCDNGPEYISATTAEWTKKRGIRIDFIQPGNSQQNAYVERYNRTVCYD